MPEDQPANEAEGNSYYEGLSQENKKNYDRLTPFVEFFPEGYDIQQAVRDKSEHGSIYILPLPSQTYIYRPLTMKESKKIKAIEGMTSDVFRTHVVSKCLIFPTVSLGETRDWLAGTESTIHDSILSSSDFATVETVPVKL